MKSFALLNLWQSLPCFNALQTRHGETGFTQCRSAPLERVLPRLLFKMSIQFN